MDPEHGDKPSVSGASAAGRVEGPSGSTPVKGKRRRRRASAKAQPHASQAAEAALVRRPQDEGPADGPARKRKRRRRGKPSGASGEGNPSAQHAKHAHGEAVAARRTAADMAAGADPRADRSAAGRGPAATRGGGDGLTIAGAAEVRDGAARDRDGGERPGLSGRDSRPHEKSAYGHPSDKSHRGERHGQRGGKEARGQRALQGRPLTSERRPGAKRDAGRAGEAVPQPRAGEHPSDRQGVSAGQDMPRTGQGRGYDTAHGQNRGAGRHGTSSAGTSRGERREGRGTPGSSDRRTQDKLASSHGIPGQGHSGPRMEQGRGPGEMGDSVDGGWRPLLRSDVTRRPQPGGGHRPAGRDGHGRGQDERDAGGQRQRGADPGQQDAPLYAALDLGTNNCRLLIAQPTRPGQFRVVDAFSRIVRLGEGLAATGRLSDEAMERSVEALRICAGKLRNRQIRMSRLIATEAARAAENGEAFLERVASETGLTLEIINRETEARLAVSGCSSLVGRDTKSVVLFDIGGGSSEIAVIRIGDNRSSRLANHITHWTSLPVGVVTLSERHGGRDVTPERFEAMVVEVAGMLAHFDSPPVEALTGDDPQSGFHLIGTSGTVTTLAGVHLDLPRYDRRRVDGVWLTDDEVSAMQARLLSWDFAARAANPCIGPDRADLVLAGCAILEAIRRRWPSTRMRVADRGLREGLLTDMMADDGAWRRSRRPFRNGRDDGTTTGGAKP
ncbi:Ppx/GppA phosphatase family protein [Rhizobium sp. RU20A]|nr:Ppx/GppA phosphatase family protein [Rhizobium sp. RU20A]